MNNASFIIYNARLVDRDTDCAGSIYVKNGNIEAVYKTSSIEKVREAIASSSKNSEIEASTQIDAKGATLLPSFIDLHAHFRDPGHTHKEDLISASKAAAAGGYGTVVLMANTDPVISDITASKSIQAKVREIGLIEAFQAVSLTRNFDAKDTSALKDLDAHIVPIASEDGKEIESAAVMLKAMQACAQKNIIVSCHCEDPDLALAAKPYRNLALGTEKTDEVLENLAKAEKLLHLAENIMTERNLALGSVAHCHVHIAHISTKESLSAVRRAKNDNSRHSQVTCEVTPHHLVLTNSISAIVNPPLRSAADQNALIAGLQDGTIDAIATDHAPHTAEDKAKGAPGFSGIQTAFAACYTSLVSTGKIALSRLSALMSANPAQILKLRTGLLQKGYPADLVLVDLSLPFTVDPENKHLWFSKGKNTPLSGVTLLGQIQQTYKNGIQVYPFSTAENNVDNI